MREAVLLLGCSSSSSSSIVSSPNQSAHPSHSPKPKSKPSCFAKRVSTPYSPLLPPARYAKKNSLFHLSSRLAEEGHLHDFASLAESLIASSGLEASHFFSELNKAALAKGILKTLRQRNVESVVDLLMRLDKLGLPPSMLFDSVSLDLFKNECAHIVNSSDLEQVIVLMETLAGFSFCIKELADPFRVIKICVNKRNPHLAVRYARLFPHEGILVCTVIKKFGEKRDLDSALGAYEASKQHSTVPNMYVYRAVIDVCGICGDSMKSRYIFEDILNQKVTPNIYVLNSLMNVNAHDLGYTLHVYKNMKNLGLTADLASYNILLKSCSLAGKVDLAQDVYREVKQLESAGELKLDDFTYCTIIKIFADAKLWQLALKVKEDMLSSGIFPNTFTWSSLISACANVGLVERAIKLFEEMLLAGCEPNTQCCNILLHACVEACQYDRAFRLFHTWKKSEVQNAFSKNRNYNVDGISSATNPHEDDTIIVPSVASNSLHLNFIKKFPFTPSLTTYNILMKACGRDYDRAKPLMDEMKIMGLSPSHISWSILIDICGNSGDMEGAIKILKNMRMAGVEPDVIAYTTAIKVCVESKNVTMAFSLFAEMKSYQVKPNMVTYDTLLRARTRYGSLKEVQQCLAIYQDMRRAGYKSNDYYLKQLIEEWCEGVIQDNAICQNDFEPYRRTDCGRPYSLLLEKVAAHLQNNIAESITIELQGLTKVEARIVVLAVLRMVKENYISGHSVKDDMWITLGIDKVDLLSSTEKSEVKDAIFKLLQNELGMEVLIAFPRYTADRQTDLEIPLDSNQKLSKSFGNDKTARRPILIQRLKVTRNSLHSWLQRTADTTRR